MAFWDDKLFRRSSHRCCSRVGGRSGIMYIYGYKCSGFSKLEVDSLSDDSFLIIGVAADARALRKGSRKKRIRRLGMSVGYGNYKSLLTV